MPSSAEWLLGQWAHVAGPAFAALTGQKLRTCADTEARPDDRAGFVTWRQETDAAPGAALWVSAGPRVWRRLGQLVLTAAGLDDSADDEIRGAYLEALQQAISALAPAMRGRTGREVNLLQGQDEEPAATLTWGALRLSDGDETLGHLHLALSPELAAKLEAAAKSQGTPRPIKAETSLRQPAQPGSKTLDLLLEVDLPVGVSFGRTQMRVKDAIKLTTGSIVELNRNVSAPVEIIVNNCVIARGEVVVVEGNYGVRIQEIVSREERLRTLF